MRFLTPQEGIGSGERFKISDNEDVTQRSFYSPFECKLNIAWGEFKVRFLSESSVVFFFKKKKK